MLQWFIRFPEFAEFTEFLFHLAKTPMALTRLQNPDWKIPECWIFSLKFIYLSQRSRNHKSLLSCIDTNLQNKCKISSREVSITVYRNESWFVYVSLQLLV